MGGEKRRQKSLRIGVHHADAVAWGPVRRTRLRVAPRLGKVHAHVRQRRARDEVAQQPQRVHSNHLDASRVDVRGGEFT
eukprot:30942-Pelagococcus_subviridis.AAC.11